MNQVVISGKITGDINHEYNGDVSTVKFKILNQKYSYNSNKKISTIVWCRCTGALADYVNTELYEGCDIIVTGYIQYLSYVVNNVKIDRLVIYCNTVSILEQEEYS